MWLQPPASVYSPRREITGKVPPMAPLGDPRRPAGRMRIIDPFESDARIPKKRARRDTRLTQCYRIPIAPRTAYAVYRLHLT